MHVDSIVLSAIPAGGPNNKAQAEITVRDNEGALVSGATVTGTFSDGYIETLSAVTDASGVATILANGKVRGSFSVGFCVDDITHASLTYAPGDNVETCDSASF
jgi:hypothetical protein